MCNTTFNTSSNGSSFSEEKPKYNEVPDQQTQKKKSSQTLSEKKEDHGHEAEMFSKQIGWLGIVFGAGEHSSRNITVFICVILIATAALVSYFEYFHKNDTVFINNVWNKIFPIITLALGYLFGKK